VTKARFDYKMIISLLFYLSQIPFRNVYPFEMNQDGFFFQTDYPFKMWTSQILFPKRLLCVNKAKFHLLVFTFHNHFREELHHYYALEMTMYLVYSSVIGLLKYIYFLCSGQGTLHRWAVIISNGNRRRWTRWELKKKTCELYHFFRGIWKQIC
jgi:hypothetical protein